MERHVRAGPPAPRDLTVDAMASLRGVTAVDPEPLLLGIYPTLAATNPYQSLLYQRAREHGCAPVWARRQWQIAELTALRQAGLPTALHLHWLHPVLRDAETPKAAGQATKEFLALLDAFGAAGGRLVWTVHNILPHETRHAAEEARLGSEVAARADVIHVMSRRTEEAAAPFYELPRDRLLEVPHMSYVGAYADHVSRLDARHALGILPDDLVFLTLGWIRPYKGLDALLDAWQALPAGPRRLVVAGEPAQDGAIGGFLERAALDPTVVLDARPIPADEIQVFLRAADVAVLPYRQSLNSGALLLALTFGVPAIVPAGSGLADLVDPSFGRTYDPDASSGLTDALAGAAELATPDARAAATAVAAALSPAVISGRFMAGLREMLRPSG